MWWGQHVLFFSFFTLASCVLVLWPFIYDIHYTSLFIYMMMYVFLHLSLCVISFLSWYTCFIMYAIYISISHMMPWWVLFKCFRKTGYESLPCHELSSCKVFQEFMLGLDLFCISISDYEFSDLRLPLWFICLLWFCHRLPNGEIVREIIM